MSPYSLQEPALNPALEEQAIGRAWRMGQKREVTVKASGWGGEGELLVHGRHAHFWGALVLWRG